jgi:iron-sulfur cluster assembly protein
MSDTNQVLTTPITLTEPAAAAVRDLLVQRNLPGHALRLFVSGGGCAGLQYGLGLEGRVREEDLAFEMHGVKVVVDEVSINYLQGATIDYVESPTGSGFKIVNPNTLPTCSCEQSSSVSGGCCGQ